MPVHRHAAGRVSKAASHLKAESAWPIRSRASSAGWPAAASRLSATWNKLPTTRSSKVLGELAVSGAVWFAGHALAVLPPVAGRPGIAIDDRDFVPAPRQCHPGVQAGWPRANDDCPHASPPLPAVTATAKSPHNSNPRERPGIRSTTQRRKPDPDTAALHGRRSGSFSVETI